MNVFARVRPLDIALAVAMTSLGVVLMLTDILTTHPHHGTRIDSHSWAMLPMFLVAPVAILWRRSNTLAVIGVAAAAVGVHDVAFGWVIRCGAGLPLAFALAYSAGRLLPRRPALLGLAGTIGLQALVLVRDSAAGLGVLPVTVGIAAVAWGIGVYVRGRSVDAPVTTPTPQAAGALV